MQLKLRDHLFRIAEATLIGFIADPYWCDRYNRGEGKNLGWSLTLKAAPEEFDEATWRPHLSCDNLSFATRDWRQIAGASFSWTERRDATGEPNGTFYAWEHGDIPRGALRFGARDGRSFALAWSGLADLFWDEDAYGVNVPFEATARVLFERIIVRGNIKDDARAFRDRLTALLNPDDFDQGEIVTGGKYDSGVGMAHCVFTPRT